MSIATNVPAVNFGHRISQCPEAFVLVAGVLRGGTASRETDCAVDPFQCSQGRDTFSLSKPNARQGLHGVPPGQGSHLCDANFTARVRHEKMSWRAHIESPLC